MPHESRALIYLRVSTDRQAQKGISIPTQQERCLECAGEQGYEVDVKTDIYIDGGESARTMDRPALLDLLNRCKEDKSVSALVVYDVSRLARNRLDFAIIKQALRKAEVTLVSATEPINDSPEGQMLEGVLSTVAEFFSAQTGRKALASMRRKAEAGGWPARAPYGYMNRKEKLPDGQIRAWIEPNPQETRWVRRAFELFAESRYSVKDLARILNAEGFPVRRAPNRSSRALHHSHLERMLRNRIYVGSVEWSDVVNEHGTHELLIDPELFYRVQDILVLRSGSTTRMRRHRSLFKGFAFCGECRAGMTIDLKETSPTRTIRYLRCRKVHKGKSVRCNQHYFTEGKYIQQLERLLQRLQLPERGAVVLKNKIPQALSQEQHVYERVRSELLRERETVVRRQENLLLRSLDDNPSDEAGRLLYERVRTELAAEHKRLTRELGRLQVHLDRITQIVMMALEIVGCVEVAFAADLDADYRGLIARVIFKEVRMRDGIIEDARLSSPLSFIRRWAGENAVEGLGRLSPVRGAQRGVSGRLSNVPRRHTSLSSIRNDLVCLQKLITPAEEADIEACYRELHKRRLL